MISTGRYKNIGETLDVAANYTTPQTNTQVIAAGGAGTRIIVRYYEFSVGTTSAAENSFILKSDGTNQKGCEKFYPALSGGTFDGVDYVCDVNAALTITTNITGNHSVYVKYNIVSD